MSLALAETALALKVEPVDALFGSLNIFIANLHSEHILGVHQAMPNAKRITQSVESLCATIHGSRCA
jgi:hypothetical protein